LSRVGSTKSEYAGGAHEVFTECVDDIQGALSFVKKQKVKDIFLAGHSTGCQKSVYWAHMRKSKGVKGIMLFAPLSDYLTILSRKKKVMAQNAEKYARKLVRERKRHQLLPSHLWPKPVDAQRFLSLYTPDSVEQSIFPYFDRARHSKMFSSVKVPIIAFFAGKDEHADRPTHAIAQWFAEQAESKTFVAHIVPKVGHSFRGGEMQIVKTLRAWFTE
jgi:hypothetical protein